MGRMKMTGGMLEKAKKVLMAHKLLNGSLTSLQSKNLKRGLGRRRHRRRKSRRMGGARVSKFLQKANSFLKKHQVLSRVGEFAIPFVPGPYVPLAQTAVGAIRKAGYGVRRHRMRGCSRMMGMRRRHCGGMGVLPPAVFNTSTSNIGIPKF